MSGKMRLEAFSDAVMAIAVTLLVIDLHVPARDELDGSLVHALLEQWPSYLAHLVSFLVIGIIWVNHHAMFAFIARVDRTVLFLNLLLLLVISTIPFPTALLAEYLRAGRDSHVAAAVYSCTMLAMSVSFLALWFKVSRQGHLLHEHVDPAAARSAIRRFGLGLLIYLATVGLSFVNATVTLVTHLVIALYYCFNQLSVRGADDETADDEALVT